jgi:hypothetical protein
MQEATPILIGSRRHVKFTTTERFNQKWTADLESGCHIWTASTNLQGYGEFGIVRRPAHKIHAAHRVSWELHRGPIPPGMKILHKCDRPRCVNPDHLFIGTQKDNMQDCVTKGRKNSAKGEKNCKAKLTVEQIQEIRLSSDRGLGRRYGIGSNQVYRIRKRIHWGHVP